MKFQIKDSENAKQMVEQMDLKALINQCVCPAFQPTEDFNTLEEYGSVFVFASEQENLRHKIKQYNQKCKIAPLIAGDFENGPGSMILGATRYPSMMASSQADSTQLVYEMGKSAAVEGLEVGYNWTFAPVVDLAIVADSPVVSLRSAGHTPEQVIKIAKAYTSGVQEHGMLATIKHFPGDGLDIYDQHLTTSVNPLTMEEWYLSSGRCFQELIDAGAMCVMPGHIALPAYDQPNAETGLYPPATLSKRLMNDLLKGELGFEGLVVSDAINMGGAVNYMNYYEACATFWENGGDVLIFVDMRGFYEEMEALIEKGILKLSTLKARAYRILCLKDQMGLLQGVLQQEKIVLAEKHIQSNSEFSYQMVDAGVTLVRDRNKIIPFQLDKQTRILHLVITNDAESYREYIQQMTQEIRKYSDAVTEVVDPGPNHIFDIIRSKQFDLVICSIGHAPLWGLNVVRLHGATARNMMNGWMKLGTPVIFVAHAHPYIHKEYAAATDTIINTYGTTAHTAVRVLEGITGKAPFNLKLVAHD